MLTMIAATDDCSVDTVRAAARSMDEARKDANGAMYGMLANTTVGRAHDLVRSEERSRCGITAWVRLRDRFSAGGASDYLDVFNFN